MFLIPGQAPRFLTMVALGTLFALAPPGPRPQSASACSIYGAAINFASESGTVVLIDSTAAGVPSFAFNAYSGYYRTPEQQGLPLSDSLMQGLRVVNEHRESLRGCLATFTGVQPVSDDTLMSIFGRDHDGWMRFRARYPGVQRFVLVSRPLMLSDSSVLVYVAQASDWLAGAGAILHLQRDSGGHWTRKAQAFLWVS